jgi:C4-type Zn-finger protein
MPACAEILPTDTQRNAVRVAFPTCPVCADTMIAAEASVFHPNDEFVSHLWACETCGYGFVTRHAFARLKN